MTRREAGLLPNDQLDEVVRAVYEDAIRLDWEHLAPADRTRQYARWISDARVGAVLTAYMTSEQARSWLKDGPIKEYARARRGAGRYARFGQVGGTGPADVVRQALGDGWTVIAGSVGVKPFHCVASRGQERAYVTWGPGANFRHLVWAALRHAVGTGGRAVVVVTESLERPTPEDEATWHKELAVRCGLEIAHMRETLGRPEPATGQAQP